MHLIYDVCHNIPRLESYEGSGQQRDVLVYRKGATRAFPAGHREISADYRRVIGQPVFGAMRETFVSLCHGAGRLMSRTAGRTGRDTRQETRKLEDAGLLLRSETRDGILEELPKADKNVDQVEALHSAGLARKVARLRPMAAVIKGKAAAQHDDGCLGKLVKRVRAGPPSRSIWRRAVGIRVTAAAARRPPPERRRVATGTGSGCHWYSAAPKTTRSTAPEKKRSCFRRPDRRTSSSRSDRCPGPC